MTDPIARDAESLGARLAAGSLRSVDLTRQLLERIDRLDPDLHAFVRTNPLALEEATAADSRIACGQGGPLTGIPIALKDNLCTAGLATSCGSRSLEGFVPLRDATAVRRLRSAGLVILGKTNMDEFGMGSSTENSAHGPTRNPWDLTRVPGGSSGGSAAAVAAGLAPLALGSDTGGSVRQPAALCGVVGLKPTYGRVSRSGLVAFGSSLDQIGPLTSTVADSARLLECIAGADEADMTASRRPTESYVEACRGGVAGLRIALPVEYLGRGLDPQIRTAVTDAASALASMGAEIEEIRLQLTRYAVPVYYLVATAEASSNLARFDGVRYGRRVDPGRGLTAMYRATRGGGLGAEVKRRIMLGTYALSAGYYEAFYGRAQRVRARLRGEFLDCFASGVDVILCPTTPGTAFRLGEKMENPLEMYLSDVFTVTASLAGLPAISVPLRCSVEGLPIGCQFIAPDFGESRLFRCAAAVESRFPPQAPPLLTAGQAT